MSFQRYPEYKDSGVAWLGEVPGHWETWKVAHAFGSIGSGTTPPSSEEHWYDSVGTPWVTTGELRENIIFETSKSVTDAALEKFSALRIHPAGSLVVAMYGATIGRLGILGVDAVTNQACCVLSSPRHLDIAFTYYWLQGFKQIIIDLFSTGGGQPNINQDTVASLRIPAPGLPEQTSIATFLDRETAKIDTLVAEQEKLIALLQEKRQAIISHAVTKGLDPNVPMKDSGVEWLGEIPAHWQMSPLKWLTQPTRPIMYGIVLPGPDVDEGIPILKGGNVKPSRMNLTEMARTTPDIEQPYARARLKASDLVYSIRGTIGDCEVVPPELEGSNITQDVARIAIDTSACHTWARWTLLSAPVREELACGSLGAAVRGVNIFDLKRVAFPTPPLAEQVAIAAHIDKETGRLEALLAEAQSLIALLQERRTALISSAVTGQIDVRGIASPQAA
ncbi:restriction endonuclease subunit S [Acidovorax sp. FJL06]|uniref:restriction endonuclease subunit S n=1 Tax=Acidovorax sp. FJL06 TaxID=2153365 RepID=UPI000F55FCD1|nr:restriction endonuclease subunit S [Acidovorax sp. FJL06]RQO81356.1 restriction endonuclease subunit S [Acidovorax sp. FJL06]